MRKILILLVLMTAFPAVFGGNNDPQCRPVNATWYESDFLIGPDNCYGYDYCFVGPLTGTPNGILTSSFSDSLTQFDVFGSGDPVNTYVGEERIDTEHGEIVSTAHGSYDLSSGMFVEMLIVKSGTGIYENATGRMLINPLPKSPTKDINFTGPFSLSGYICTQ
jgi:hypothetical protein